MQTILTYGFYAALAAVFIVLALGVANLTRGDERQVSRSNQLMRLRVLFQFLAVVLLVALGAAAGMIKF